MKHIIAVIRSDQLEGVESRLRDAEAPGLSVSMVKGYGEYANFFSHDWMVRHVRLEMFVPDADAPRLASVISDAARTGVKGDGILAVEPVDRFLHIRSRQGSGPERRPSTPAVPASAEMSRITPKLWTAVTIIGLAAIAVSVVISAKHQLHLLSLSLLAVLVLSAAVGLFSLTRRRGNRPGGGG